MRAFTIRFNPEGKLDIRKGLTLLDRFIDDKPRKCIYTDGITEYIILPDKYDGNTVDNIKMERTIASGIRVMDDLNDDRVMFYIDSLCYETTEILKPDIEIIDCPMNHKFLGWPQTRCYDGIVVCAYCKTPIITWEHPMYDRIIDKPMRDASCGYSKEHSVVNFHLKDGRCKSVIEKVTDSKAIVPNSIYEIGIGDTLFFHIENAFTNRIISVTMTADKKLSVVPSKLDKSTKLYHREE